MRFLTASREASRTRIRNGRPESVEEALALMSAQANIELPSMADVANVEDKDSPTWVTREKHKVKVHQMSDRHLRFAHRHCVRHKRHISDLRAKALAYLVLPLPEALQVKCEQFVLRMDRALKHTNFFINAFEVELASRNLAALPA